MYYSSSSQSRIYVCRATKTLEVEHTHTWDEGKITKASTCTKKGTKTFTCTVCGKTRNQEVSVVAHKFTTWKTTTAATALASAKQTHKCSTCGKTETRNYGNKLKPSIKVNISSIPPENQPENNTSESFRTCKRRFHRILEIQQYEYCKSLRKKQRNLHDPGRNQKWKGHNNHSTEKRTEEEYHCDSTENNCKNHEDHRRCHFSETKKKSKSNTQTGPSATDQRRKNHL